MFIIACAIIDIYVLECRREPRIDPWQIPQSRANESYQLFTFDSSSY